MFKTTPTFPAELIARCQWVGWKYVARKHKPKPGKVPYNPKRGVKAKSNNPTTWGTLEEAIRLCRIFHMDGFGFVFSPNDPYCGVDLDGCRDPETGTIEPWAGVHIIIRGTLPPGNHKKPYGGGTVEAYDTGRFFTMTGEHLEGTPLSIENRETELQAFHARYLGEEKCSKGESTKAGHQPTHPPNCTQSSAEGLSDDQIIVRASCAANGDRFNDLFWYGEWQGKYPSQSEADMALCGHLAFWSGKNPEQMDRLFRQSALMREKWDELRGTETYGERTIKTAISNQQNVYMPSYKKPRAA